jgi:predicted  nucleic acid-binding Zn-ribbon protein
MANLTKHVMINKWDNDINDAIVAVGGKTYGSGGLPDYADIIRSQLISNSAVGEGIYQDFLYVNEDNQPSIYPWDGTPTDSTNAVQSKVVAEALASLYDTMALTERFQVLLVDEFPKSEVNLSAVYLVRKKCECGNEECTCECNENTYQGCYYVKSGKKLRRVDIPDFELDLSSLFFLTRAEYDAGLSNYVHEIEEMLRKKFGKYWDDEGFALDEVIDNVILEMQEELKAKTDEVIAQVNETVADTLDEMTKQLDAAKGELKTEFDSLKTDVGSTLSDIQSEVDAFGEQVQALDTKVDELDQTIRDIDADMQSKFVSLEGELDTKLQEFQAGVETKLNTKFEDLESSVSESITGITQDMSDLRGEVETFRSETDTKIEDLNAHVEEEFVKMNESLNEFQSSVESELNDKFTALETTVNETVSSIAENVSDLTERVEKFENDTNDAIRNLTDSVATQFEVLGGELDTKFETLNSEVDSKVAEISNKVDSKSEELTNIITSLSDELDAHISEADAKYLSKADTISGDQLNELK